VNNELVRAKFERSNGTLVVRLSGEIDLSNADDLQAQLKGALHDSTRVVIDLAEIVYLDSQGLRLIKQLVREAREEDTQLELVAPPGNFARQVLDMTRMSDYIEIHDRLDD
jgi:anti-anti-sigma factor